MNTKAIVDVATAFKHSASWINDTKLGLFHCEAPKMTGRSPALNMRQQELSLV